ncbi:MAG TPA: peptidyl-prolyl cis-trans isomerase, partial [Thermodesulfobacteriota bacterium]|nr:peptidyl-prolyl cis-trans isomerase [Thermodesulfobacteriota bacterium]
DTTEPTEAEIQDYFEKNKEQFRVPDTIKLEYVTFAPKDFAGQVTITDDEIRQYYTDFSDEFWEPERVRARHILVKVAETAKPEEKQKAREKAQDLQAQLEKGASFESLAGQHSDDPASAKQGGDLGFFSRGQMVKPFEEAAFSLEPGKISEIVESPFGYHIIKVEEKEPEGAKPLEEVKETIRTTIIDSRSAELCKREAFRTYRSSLKAKNLRAYAEANGLKIEESEAFSRDKSLPIFLESPEALEEAFKVSSGEMVYPFSAQGTFYVSRVTARVESHVPELAKIKDEVQAILKEEHSERAAHDKGEALLAAARDIGDLGAAAKNENVTVKTTRFFTRVGRSIPDIGSSPELMTAAFSLDANRPFPDSVFPFEGKIYVVKWAGKDEVRKEDFERKKKDLSERYLRLKKSEYMDAWLKLARDKAEIVINPDLVR